MKKALLTILCAAFGLCAMAQNVKTYTEPYIVAVNEVPTDSKTADIDIEDNADGTINFVFKKLVVTVYNQDLTLEEVRLDNIDAFELNGTRYFEKEEGTYSIPASSLPSAMQMMAGAFQNIKYDLSGYTEGESLFATLQIHMTQLGQEIVVVIGEFDTSRVYSNDLIVTVNGETSDPQKTDVTVSFNTNGTLNFALKNFILSSGEESMPVGNIVVENIPVTSDENNDEWGYFTYNGNIVIQEGDMEGVEMWMGPAFQEIPVTLKGKLSDEKLYVLIDISTPMLGNVHVQLGYAKLYAEALAITVGTEQLPSQQADVIVVDNGDDTINFLLKNFVLGEGEVSMPIGNIYVENIAVTVGEDGLKHFVYDAPLTIREGSLELGEGQEWVGPSIGEIPVVLQGKMNDNKMFATISLTFAGLPVFVQLGTDDFEQPAIIRTYTEPYYVTAVGATPTPQDVTVVIYDRGDEIDFELKDFVLDLGDMQIPFGDLTLHSLEAWQEEDGKTHFKGERTVSVPDDKIPAEYQQFAYFLKNLPVTVTGKFDENRVYAEFDTNVPMFNIAVHVQIGLSTGDVNGDGAIDISDVVSVLSAMAGGNTVGDSDANGDGVTDIADVVMVLSIMAGN